MDVSNLGYVDIVCGLRNLISSGSDFQDVRYRQFMYALNNYRTRRGENLQEWVELDGKGQNPFDRQQYECLLTQIDVYINYLAKGLVVPSELLSKASNIQSDDDGVHTSDNRTFTSPAVDGTNYTLQNFQGQSSTYDTSYSLDSLPTDAHGAFNYKQEEPRPMVKSEAGQTASKNDDGKPILATVHFAKSSGDTASIHHARQDTALKNGTVSDVLMISDILHRSSDFWGPGCFWLDYKDNLDQNKLTFILTAVTNLKNMLEYVMHVNTKESVENLKNLTKESGLYEYICGPELIVEPPVSMTVSPESGSPLESSSEDEVAVSGMNDGSEGRMNGSTEGIMMGRMDNMGHSAHHNDHSGDQNGSYGVVVPTSKAEQTLEEMMPHEHPIDHHSEHSADHPDQPSKVSEENEQSETVSAGDQDLEEGEQSDSLDEEDGYVPQGKKVPSISLSQSKPLVQSPSPKYAPQSANPVLNPFGHSDGSVVVPSVTGGNTLSINVQEAEDAQSEGVPYTHLKNTHVSLVRLENMINLLILQRSLRSMISLVRVLDYSPNFKQPERSFGRDILEYIRHFNTLHRENRKVSRKNATAATRAIEAAIKRVEMQESAKQKQRLEALKAHNEEAYIKLLKESKESKFLQIIQQTEVYMDYMSHLLVRARHVAEYARACAAGEAGMVATDSTLHSSDHPADSSGVNIKVCGESQDESPPFRDAKSRYYAVANCVKEDIKSEYPSLNGKLRKYQIDGLNWLVSLYNNKLNGIFADEMGLGKTVQTIALLAYLKDHKGISGVHMVLAPLSTLHGNWKTELENWFPSCKICVYEGTKEYRKTMRNRWYENGSCRPNFDVLLTTDSFILRDKTYLRKICWEYLIVDEAHRLKNPNSKLVKVLNQGFVVNRRLALTGTPLQNDLHELWALLNFLMPELFASSKTFDEWFNVPLGSVVRTKDMDSQQAALSEEEQLLIIDRIHKTLKPFLLRREKYDVADEVPLNFEHIVCCPMSGIQTRLYEFLSCRETTHNKMIQLRKVINHPYLYCPDNFPCDDNIIMSCGKFAVLDIILARLFQVGHRVLIFSQMTTLLDILEVYLCYRNYKYLRLDGSLSSDQRVDRLKKFNEDNSPYFVFILSTKAGALGLNLQTADTVIIYDSDWNPQVDIQAQSRVHRIGQKSQVITIRFVTPNTVEENILKSTSVKLSQDALAIKSGEYHGVQVEDKSTQDEVIKILRRNNECEESYGVRTIERLDEILARSDQDKRSFYFTAFKTFMMNPFGVIQERVIPPFLYQSIANSKRMLLTESDRILLSVEEDTWNSILLDYDIYAVEPTDECMSKFSMLLENCNSREYSDAFLYAMDDAHYGMDGSRSLHRRMGSVEGVTREYLERGKRLKIAHNDDQNVSLWSDHCGHPSDRMGSMEDGESECSNDEDGMGESDDAHNDHYNEHHSDHYGDSMEDDEDASEGTEENGHSEDDGHYDIVESKSSSIDSLGNDHHFGGKNPAIRIMGDDAENVRMGDYASLGRVPSSNSAMHAFSDQNDVHNGHHGDHYGSLRNHHYDHTATHSGMTIGAPGQVCSITSLDLSYPQERIRNLDYFMRYLNDKPSDKIKEEKTNALRMVLKEVLMNVMGDAKFVDFAKLPDKTVYVDYYDKISHPISLSCILNSLCSIESLHTFKKQMELILSNCMTYNGAESAIFRRSIELYAHVNGQVYEKLATEYIKVYNPNKAKEFAQIVANEQFPSNWKINPLFK